jgi:DnaJ-class molecular chaperone
VAWNKRGSSRGGASTGRDGVKRGGRDGSAGSKTDPDTEKNYTKRGATRSPDLDPVDTADCPTCNGTGKLRTDRGETDDDGRFTGTQETECSACDGQGRVTKK